MDLILEFFLGQLMVKTIVPSNFLFINFRWMLPFKTFPPHLPSIHDTKNSLNSFVVNMGEKGF